MKRAGRKAARWLLLCALLAGCATQEPKPAVPPQPDTVRLTRVAFADLPGFGESAAALAAFRKSCAVLAGKPDSAPMLYAGTAADWRAVCGACRAQPGKPMARARPLGCA